MEDQALAPNVSTRRSRRRKPKSVNEKENKPLKGDAVVSRRSADSERNLKTKSEEKPSSKQIKLIQSEFRSAVKRTSHEKFWKEESSLGSIVVNASVAASDDRTEGLILLSSKSTELFNMSRQLIKEASKTKKSDVIEANLVVGLHILRAVGPLMADNEKRERVIKLLYHCVALSEQISKNSEHATAVFNIASGAYEGMGAILSLTSVELSRRKISFQKSRVQGDLLTYDFVNPCQRKGRAASNAAEFKEISSIVVQAIFSLARTLANISISTKSLGEIWWCCSSETGALEWKRESRTVVNTLLWEVFSVWNSTVAQQEGSTSESIKYGKQAHRILWGAASTISQTKKDCDECLELRKNAILLFLQSAGEHETDETPGVVDTACTYAWKTAASYVSTSNHMIPCHSGCLYNFHAEIGNAFGSMESMDGVSVIEYQTFRAMHIESIEVTETRRAEDLASLDFMATLRQLLGVAVSLWKNLRKDREPAGLLHFTEEWITALSERVNKKDIKREMQKQSDDDFKRIFRLLSAVPLHRKIHNVLKDGVPQSAELLLACSRLLCHVLAPMYGHFIEVGGSDSDVEAKAWEVTTDSYIQGISAIEQAVHSTEGKVMPEGHRDADQLMWVAVERIEQLSLFPCDTTQKAILRMSKALMYNGKNRNSVGPQYVFQPVLTSIKLCSILRRKFELDFKTLNMERQWSLVARALKSAGHDDESIFATAFALRFSILEAGEGSNLTQEAALVQLMQSLGSLPPLWITRCDSSSLPGGGDFNALVGKFVTLHAGRSDFLRVSSGAGAELTLENAVAILRETGPGADLPFRFESTIQVQFSMCSLLETIICNCRELSSSCCEPGVILSGILSLVEAANQAGALLQLDSVDDSDDLALVLSGFQQMVQLARRLTNFLGKGSPLADVANAILCCVSSVSPIICNPHVRQQVFLSYPLASKLTVAVPVVDRSFLRSVLREVKSATDKLNSISKNQSGEKDLAATIRPRLLIYFETISRFLGDQTLDSFSDVRELFRDLDHVEANATTRASVQGIVKDSLNSARCLFADTASVAGSWISDASSSTLAIDSKTRSWFSSKAVSALIQGFVSTISPDLSRIDDSLTMDSPVGWETNMSLSRISIRAELSVERKRKCIAELRDQVSQVENEIGHETDLLRVAVLTWACSTGKAAIAEGFTQLGDTDDAILHWIDCLTGCRRVSSIFLKVGSRRRDQNMFESVHTQSLVARCRDRQLYGMVQLSEIYSSVGDRRKSSSYLMSALDLLGVENPDALCRRGASWDVQTQSPRHSQIYRLWYSLRSRETGIMTPRLSSPDILSCDFDSKMEWVLDCMLPNSSSFKSSGPGEQGVVNPDESVLEAYRGLSQDPTLIDLIYDKQGCDMKLNARVFGHIQLQTLRTLLTNDAVLNSKREKQALNILEEIRGCPGVGADVLAESCYLVGLFYVDKARTSGELTRLWDGFSNIQGRGHKEYTQGSTGALAQSVLLLKEALLVMRQSSDDLTRSIIRTLALATGPTAHQESNMCRSAYFLVQCSISRTWRVMMTDATSRRRRPFKFSVSTSDADISDFYDQLADNTPSPWRYVSGALCPTGELILTSFDNGELAVVCVFPSEERSFQDKILSPLCELVAQCEKQLKGLTEVSKQEFGEKEARREWWNERKSLDERLENLLFVLDETLSGTTVKAVLLGGAKETGCDNLTSKFDSVVSHEGPGELSTLSCTFLTLDENLQKLPIESIPMLRGRAISRLPCISFALSHLQTNGAHVPLLAKHTKFVLDPELDLSGTKERLLPVVGSLGQNRWEGVVGKAPTKDFFRTALSQERGLLLYFGHGGAEKFFSAKDIRQLSKDESDPVTSAVVLMGCSSGRLLPICENKSWDYDAPGFYEPDGIALSYLASGAPFVVGNLWDVTDQDIDKFSIAFLTDMLSPDRGTSVALAVANARDACKMGHIVGCAPICYGMPLSVSWR